MQGLKILSNKTWVSSEVESDLDNMSQGYWREILFTTVESEPFFHCETLGILINGSPCESLALRNLSTDLRARHKCHNKYIIDYHTWDGWHVIGSSQELKTTEGSEESGLDPDFIRQVYYGIQFGKDFCVVCWLLPVLRCHFGIVPI